MFEQCRDQRSTEEVISSHLALRRAGRIEDDVRGNYAAGVVIIDSHRIYHGQDGVRQSARILAASLPGATFEYDRVQTCGGIAYLLWRAETLKDCVRGIDSFVVQGGRIVAQTIYYHVDQSSSATR